MEIENTPQRRRGRPPKDTEGYGKTREALVRAGLEVLTEKGYTATGLDEILKRVSVPKGSFYHYFESKDAFGLELIDTYAAYFARKLDRYLTDESMPPLQRLRAFTIDAEAGMAKYQYRRGCLVGNLGQEVSALPELFRERLEAVFADWQARVEKCLQAAKDKGEISPWAQCARLAEVFWIGWEGAVLRARLDQGPEPLRSFAEFYLSELAH